MLPDSDAVGRIIAETAAAEITPRFRQLGEGEVGEKRPGEVVTIADTAAESRLARALGALLPGSRFVGEEGVHADPGSAAALAGADPVWVVDPLDGTANFAAGIPCFVSMVALVRAGCALMGWIHDPLSRRTASAAVGEGAWCDGRRLRVAPVSAAGRPDGEGGRRRGNRRLVRRLGEAAGLVDESFDLRCAGKEYLALAEGEAQFALYLRLHPWDHAAGELLFREAGGISARLDGSPYTPRESSGGLLLAPDPASWRALRQALEDRL